MLYPVENEDYIEQEVQEDLYRPTGMYACDFLNTAGH